MVSYYNRDVVTSEGASFSYLFPFWFSVAITPRDVVEDDGVRHLTETRALPHYFPFYLFQPSTTQQRALSTDAAPRAMTETRALPYDFPLRLYQSSTSQQRTRVVSTE